MEVGWKEEATSRKPLCMPRRPSHALALTAFTEAAMPKLEGPNAAAQFTVAPAAGNPAG